MPQLAHITRCMTCKQYAAHDDRGCRVCRKAAADTAVKRYLHAFVGADRMTVHMAEGRMTTWTHLWSLGTSAQKQALVLARSLHNEKVRADVLGDLQADHGCKGDCDQCGGVFDSYAGEIEAGLNDAALAPETLAAALYQIMRPPVPLESLIQGLKTKGLLP